MLISGLWWVKIWMTHYICMCELATSKTPPFCSVIIFLTIAWICCGIIPTHFNTTVPLNFNCMTTGHASIYSRCYREKRVKKLKNNRDLGQMCVLSVGHLTCNFAQQERCICMYSSKVTSSGCSISQSPFLQRDNITGLHSDLNCAANCFCLFFHFSFCSQDIL